MGHRNFSEIISGIPSDPEIQKLDRYETEAKLLVTSRKQVTSIDALVEATQSQNQQIANLIEETRNQNRKINNLTAATQTLLDETKIQGKTSSRLTKISLVLSILAVVLAGTAVWFAARDSVSDRAWMREQVGVLQAILEEISLKNEASGQ